jgi:hypothetical protein
MLYGATAGITKNEHKMRENLRLRNAKSGFDCNDKIAEKSINDDDDERTK